MERSAIITVRSSKRNYDIDMEVPLDVSISILSQEMLRTLRQKDRSGFGYIDHLGLYYEGKRLAGDAALQDYGIWDGGIVEVKGG